MIRKVVREKMYIFETREKLDVIAKKRHGGTESRFLV